MARPDLTVVGAGIFGLSIAWAAARRGARVLVVERGRIGAGASGGLVGALSPHVPEQWNDKKQFQLDSLLMAEGWWKAVETASGRFTGYGRLGRLQSLADAAAVEAARARAIEAETLWQGLATWEVTRARHRWAPVSASGWMVSETLSARLHPRRAVESLAEAIRGHWGRIEQGVESAGIVEMLGEEDGPVVWATGVDGLATLSADLGRPMGTGVKGQALSLRMDMGDAPQIFADGVHVIPHADGTVAIGSTSERDWEDPAATDGQLDDVLARAIAACPWLRGAPVIDRWAGLRPRARSRAPMLGEWPGRPGQFIANGGFKIGFGMAPKVAEVMADLVLEGRDAIPAAFRPEASF
jgi:glycine/D-amino acid oxidase-like deaminating enzyme